MRCLLLSISYLVAALLAFVITVHGAGWGPGAIVLAGSFIAWISGAIARELLYSTRSHKIIGVTVVIFAILVASLLVSWRQPTTSLLEVEILDPIWAMMGAVAGFVCTGQPLPGLSGSMYVALLRHIQSIHEARDWRNPDTRVGKLLPRLHRWRAARLNHEELARLREDPFYYHLIARTRYYDAVVHDAVYDCVQRIVNVGCGSDTRAYRFQGLLRNHGVTVLECDQPKLIAAKQRLVKWWRGLGHVEYLSIDLNDGAWPELERWLRSRSDAKTLVMMEGVSPYVDGRAFVCFLKFLAATLSRGSLVAYDFKLRGVDDDFGRGGRTEAPFRLSKELHEVVAFHAALGLRLDRFELSAALRARLLPGASTSSVHFFDQDGLVQLRVV